MNFQLAAQNCEGPADTVIELDVHLANIGLAAELAEMVDDQRCTIHLTVHLFSQISQNHGGHRLVLIYLLC